MVIFHREIIFSLSQIQPCSVFECRFASLVNVVSPLVFLFLFFIQRLITIDSVVLLKGLGTEHQPHRAPE